MAFKLFQRPRPSCLIVEIIKNTIEKNNEKLILFFKLDFYEILGGELMN